MTFTVYELVLVILTTAFLCIPAYNKLMNPE